MSNYNDLNNYLNYNIVDWRDLKLTMTSLNVKLNSF